MRAYRSALLAGVMLLASLNAEACSPAPGWKPPTPESAYRDSDVVVHVRVVSQQKGGLGWIAKVETLRVLKGRFSGDSVSTGKGSMCGIGGFKEGAEYVFFFGNNDSFVSHLAQPWKVTTEQILEALEITRLLVKFGSLCCGPDGNAIAKLAEVVSGYENKIGQPISSKRVYWGMEGDFTQCFSLSELDGPMRDRFVSDVKAALRSGTVKVEESAVCKGEWS